MRKGGRDGRSRDPRREPAIGELRETVIKINRSATVVKGGRRFSFSALVVVGDRDGRVGVGFGKAKEVPPAVEKAVKAAKRRLHRLSLKEGTIPHTIWGRFGASVVFLRPAPPGTGVIAGGAIRAMLDAAGVRNIFTKAHGSRNPINMVKATMDALTSLRTREEVERIRGVTLTELHQGDGSVTS